MSAFSIDIHSHFLPGVDDGPDTVEESVRMAEMAVEDGRRIVYCTSHLSVFGSDSVGARPETLDDPIRELERRRGIMETLQRELDARGIPLELRLGAEWMMDPDVLDLLERSPLGFLGGSKAFLFELSSFSPLEFVPQFVALAVDRGWQPVLAHPERYSPVTAESFRRLLKPVVEEGGIMQLTSGSFTGMFGPRVKSLVEMIAKEFPRSVVIASDAHESELRTPQIIRTSPVPVNFPAALEKALAS
ncbi:tyrosine-protein phosphatase [Sutterella sp.]|uniref:tyrosine-protein phosphatase n=1 Tax=Sutterella sp. TaxID=1981025 RepID=UPI0026E050B2|nr:CpsB/CapC family capsule biosynthesis tyrosine phosphatase [Sutterella sp.]MDO5530797.1 hypothetical protein [Sutterella sp.]